MAKRGRKVSPDLLRYESAGRVPALYLIEIDGGVKVGISHRPVARLREHHRRHGSLGRFCVSPAPAANLWAAEQRCIKVLSSKWRAAPGRIEYFSGVDYDAALLALTDAGVF